MAKNGIEVEKVEQPTKYCVNYFNKDLEADIIETFTDCNSFVTRLVDIELYPCCEILSVSTFNSSNLSRRKNND